MQAFTVFILCVLAFCLVLFKFSDGKKVSGVVYQVAIQSDFVENFDCLRFKASEYRALFIGPDQQTALFLPRDKEGSANTEVNLADNVFTKKPDTIVGIRSRCEPSNEP